MSNGGVRYRAIDGLRGLAALGVVFYHLNLNLQPELAELLPGFIIEAFRHGHVGVPAFFVISGFVIAYSIGPAQITARYAGIFALRRAIRLDPCYWLAIALAIALIVARNTLLGRSEPLPDLGVVLGHMFYLQDVLQLQPVLSLVFWTLCLEIQLYLFYLLTQWLAQRARGRHIQRAHLIILLGVGLLSLGYEHRLLAEPWPGLFLRYWHYFLCGVLIARLVRGMHGAGAVLLVWLALEMTGIVLLRQAPFAIAGLATAALIAVLAWRQALDRVFVSRPLQYLGALSYTLYLFHADIGWSFISACKLLLGDAFTAPVSGLVLVLALGVCIASADLIHRLVERPTHALSRRLRPAG